MTRRTRARRSRGPSVVGRRFTTEVGPVAHGGHCVARVDVGEERSRVVFVRHALPGERVELEVTEGTAGDRFWRADAVRVLVASPDRVVAPCPVAGPGGCGGCDFQHVAPDAQRRLKAAVVREQLVRLAGLDPEDPLVADLVVEEVPAGPGPAAAGLRWRTRVEYADAGGVPGMRRHRSGRVVPVADCLITRHDALVRGPFATVTGPVVEEVAVTTTAGRAVRRFAVDADGFWQAHREAPTVLVETVLGVLGPRPGEQVLDLYAGVGLFAAFLGDAVGPHGAVVAVEGNRAAAAHARENLADVPARVRVRAQDVATALTGHGRGAPPERADLVVLDPPREGARRTVVEAVAARAPRAVAHVACDPAALARDLALFAEQGYRARVLRAFDLFPMTHHLECVALLEPA